MRQRFVPIEEISDPHEGTSECLVNHWWVHVPERGVMFSGQRGDIPQCNRDENVSRVLQGKLYPNAEIIQIPLAYVRRNDEED